MERYCQEITTSVKLYLLEQKLCLQGTSLVALLSFLKKETVLAHLPQFLQEKDILSLVLEDSLLTAILFTANFDVSEPMNVLKLLLLTLRRENEFCNNCHNDRS